MWYIHIKHDNIPDDKGGRKGKTRTSIGPYSRKSAVYEANQIRMKHRVFHMTHTKGVVCIVTVEREPLDIS